ncbi:MAG: DNA polymerase III subunit gamma/tau [Clostridia bacterium]|nr:DNA polymerase III subunit gamma/tau [Clostridia bacterium]
MHQALYRKWRPRDFDDVCGQDHVTSILKNEIETGRINHAYLFCGSRGTGKTSCAKIFAKAVNCLDYKNGKVCGKCAACLSADAGTATDIIEMDAASNNGVSNIRDIRDEVNYLPSELKYRVYIVDEVHMLSVSAFNALLKTLEEPPAHVIFILATTELQKLPATIISRCQRFDFGRISSSVIADRLETIAKAEGFELEREAAFSIASIAQGGMRDAISLLELCANGAPDARVDEEIVASLIGTGDREAVEKTAIAIARRDFDTLFAITSKIYMSSRDMSVFWQALTSFYRDMLVIKVSSSAKEYLDLSDGRFNTLKTIADEFSNETLVYHTKILDDAYASMQRNGANKRLVAECALVKMSDERLSPTIDALSARVAALERALESGVPARASTPKDGSVAEPVKAAEAKPAEVKKRSAHIYEPMPEPPVIGAVPGKKDEPSGEKAEAFKTEEKKIASNDPREVRRLKSVPYFPEVVRSFGALYTLESAFLEEASAYAQEDGSIRIRVQSDIAAMMLAGEETFNALLSAFNSYEGGRLDKSTLLIETVSSAKKNSYIEEIIEDQ